MSESHTAESVLNRVQESRILLRNCANFKGLPPKYIRISIKSHEVNRQLVEKLHELFPPYARSIPAAAPARLGPYSLRTYNML